MRYLKKWKLFESISDDAYEKFSKAKSEYNDKIELIKREYLEEVSECMFDLTDEFDNTSSVEIKNGNIFAKFNFDVKPDRIDDFFNIISKRYENRSTIITTNKDFEHWNDIFEDEVLTKAIVDRVIHHAKIFHIKGQSYRTRKQKNEGVIVKCGVCKK